MLPAKGVCNDCRKLPRPDFPLYSVHISSLLDDFAFRDPRMGYSYFSITLKIFDPGTVLINGKLKVSFAIQSPADSIRPGNPCLCLV